ncbi:MAG: HD domain-containing protein [Candidatus Woesearchaeota archaeon]|nr:HD domain-containing protein [Candidatus Woesearchaeota archaeon]
MDITTQILEEAKSTLSCAKGSHDWEHTERVYQLCMHIGRKERADMEIVQLAALLHDIGRRHEDESKGKICHAEKGAELASAILKKYHIDDDKIKQITHCIECHRFRNNKIPQSKEAKVLFDADKLDSIGAVGIGRAFLFAGEVGAKLHNHNIKDIENTEPYSEDDTAYREFMVKLRKIKDKMLTDEGKRIAEARHRFMVEFFDRLNKEVDGEL